MPFGLGFGEMILIFAVLLLFFGGKRLPEVAQGLGKGIREFKQSLSGPDEPEMQSHHMAAPPQVQQPLVTAQAPPQASPAPEAAPTEIRIEPKA